MGIFLPSFGLLYIVKPFWALIVFFFSLTFGFISFAYVSYANELYFIGLVWIIRLSIGVYVFNTAKSLVKQRFWYSRWYGLMTIFLLIIFPLILFRIFYFGLYTIPAESMSPTLEVGDSIVVSKKGCGNYKIFNKEVFRHISTNDCTIKLGDVIVFEYPNDRSVPYIKRVIGLPGDTVSYQEKVLTVNGEVIEHKILFNGVSEILIEENLGDKSYQIKHRNRSYLKDGEWHVPENHYFVLGDNRDNSADSRMWGFVPKENIIGKLYYTFNKSKK